MRVERCNFTNSHATDRGGVITIFGSTAEIIETNTYDNTADLGELLFLATALLKLPFVVKQILTFLSALVMLPT